MTSTTTNATIDSGTDFSTMAEEFAKRLEWKINDDNHESQNINNVVSSIIRQVSGKKIWIFLHQLLEIVKPEIQQDIINSIANSDISRRNRTSCKKILRGKARKKLIFNDTASESSSTSESGSSSESSNDNEDFTVKVVKAKKRD
ncbi:hypothetical protein C2G38_2213981 [Gigaspora rosea]|uniref:Uncharacterized protein n=1 Tax=Gigaspora rosea TaxID=44941 RepID=A0A397UDC9_9GLOM|nr:hypothetical protein C2G38_2213977 [Gigaspora rosea]RIB07611.1 hypothetical protein C2G38_2213981 [Gigaspora rosea]